MLELDCLDVGVSMPDIGRGDNLVVPFRGGNQNPDRS